MITIKNFKGIDLKYCESDGLIYFNFEGYERKTKYIFEAEMMIDEPVWEECNLEGYFADGYIDKFIGLAKAIKRNIKNGEPYWLYKGEYDQEFKRKDRDDRKVYFKNDENNKVYQEWKNQKEIYLNELRNLNNIVSKLSNPTGEKGEI